MASPDNTIITGSGAAILDAAGNSWTIQDGKIVVNGIVDPSTGRVGILAYETGKVWQMNADRLWWSASAPLGVWEPPDGTFASPLVGVASPDNTVLTRGGPGTITDGNADAWTITADGKVAVNGIADAATGRVVALAFEKGMVWQENADGLWWSKANAAAQWTPPSGAIVSPVPTGPLQVQPFDLPPTAADGLRQVLRSVKINDSSDLVGVAAKLTPIGKSAGFASFQYSDGELSESMPGGFLAVGINDQGQIAGAGGLLNSSGQITLIAGPQGEPTSVRGINDLGQVVGTYIASGSQHGFIATGDSFETIDVPGGENATIPNAVNDLGQVVGTFWDTIGAHGFLYDHGSFTTIDVADAIYVEPTGISDGGEIVGTYTLAVGSLAVDHGFIDIGGNLQSYDVPGATQTAITGVNNRGEVAGWFDDAAGRHGFIATPTV